MELISSKILVLTLLGVLRLFFGLLPLKITRQLKEWGQDGNRRLQVDVVISLCLCFGGGVLMATCFIHMIPEVRESLLAVHNSGGLASFDGSFPLAELLVCCGFFLVYIIEEAAQHFFLKSHTKAGAPLHCSTSVDPERAPENECKVEVAPWSGRSGKIVPATSQSHLLASTVPPEQAQSSPPLTNGRKHADSPKTCTNTTNLERTFTNHKVTATDSSQKKSLTDLSLHHQHFCSGGLQEHTLVGSVRNLLVVVALSFHSVFEGLAIGLQPTHADVWYMFTAVAIHAAAILFCIGLELATSGAKFLRIVVYVVILALVSPLGVIIGVLVTSHSAVGSIMQTLLIAILQGLAGGTILYITFFEVLDRERKRENGCGAVRIVSILLGFCLMVVLQLVGGHDHSAGEGHTILFQNASAEQLHHHNHNHDHDH